ncbi:hypothetical protein DFQ27_004094 [Actinomortierella ambigua]|uniref:CYTH domain-containing protein n=1 Tax=Actinomortierella ambigua TaxID=1343610 RepID=A0A9P6U4U5_9FUNG|nr:hypothetical protein DFQ27_004094 [Actinomortierella ambigua]
MEIEIKIRLASEQHVSALEQALNCPLLAKEDQENIFFEGKHQELIRQRLVFRIRLVHRSDGQSPLAIVALKGNAVLVNGIATCEEEEAPIDSQLALQVIEDPSTIPEVAKRHALLQKIVDRVQCPEGYVVMGRFRNVRHKYAWHGYKVEVDRTTVRAGEASTSLLDDRDITYSFSQRNKFDNMRFASLI